MRLPFAGGLGEGARGALLSLGSSVPPLSPAPATYDGKHHQPLQKARGVNTGSGSQSNQISSDVHGLLHASILTLLCAGSHVAGFACTKGCLGSWMWLPRPYPDPAGSQDWEKPFLPACASSCKGRWEGRAGGRSCLKRLLQLH